MPLNVLGHPSAPGAGADGMDGLGLSDLNVRPLEAGVGGLRRLHSNPLLSSVQRLAGLFLFLSNCNGATSCLLAAQATFHASSAPFRWPGIKSPPMHDSPMFSFLSCSPVTSHLLESKLHASPRRSWFYCTPPHLKIFSNLGFQIGFGAFALFAGGYQQE